MCIVYRVKTFYYYQRTLQPNISRYSRENTVLRASLNPSTVHVIPNAVVADQFKPATEPLPLDTGKNVPFIFHA